MLCLEQIRNGTYLYYTIQYLHQRNIFSGEIVGIFFRIFLAAYKYSMKNSVFKLPPVLNNYKFKGYLLMSVDFPQLVKMVNAFLYSLKIMLSYFISRILDYSKMASQGIFLPETRQVT